MNKTPSHSSSFDSPTNSTTSPLYSYHHSSTSFHPNGAPMAGKAHRSNELLSFMSANGSMEANGEELNEVENNSDSGSSSYEWVYYDVEECKSCDSSDENDMYANEIN